jgi:glucosamine--fructose-6-phosphate aminotransferase (isomerizing)
MCGIIGISGGTPVTDRLLDSLKRLEYRGYDSAGVAALGEGGHLDRRRASGKIRNLEAVLRERPLPATVGIGHTRWATHGAPNERNAHPHITDRVAVVHNGIIENFAELKRDLLAAGHVFASDTDTEVIAHLIQSRLDAGDAPVAALKATLDRLHGAYALAVLIQGEGDLVLGARRGSPLVVGWGDDEMFIGSDALAVGPFTNKVTYLEEGDYVAIHRNSAEIFDVEGRPADRPAVTVSASAALVEKGNYRHFMEKEIHEQAESCQHTLTAYVDPVSGRVAAPTEIDWAAVPRIQIVACGTAYYAGQIGRYLFEKIAGLPCDVEIASEFRYRSPALQPGTLALAVSQSGETADTLAALRWCSAHGLQTAAVVNVHESTMAREAVHLWPTRAGPEIGVASTKAFTSQVTALTCLAIAAAVARGRMDETELARAVAALMETPGLINEALKQDAAIHEVAAELQQARDVLYLGRGPMYPLAMEGAQKLKEISYIHAEGYAAGELKHGPIALIDEDTPVIILAPEDEFFEKTASNLQEVAARGGRVIAITDPKGAARVELAR